VANAKSVPEVLQELWELLKVYAQQETLDPLKGLGRNIGMGLGGALAISMGTFLLALSVLRLLQRFSVFDEAWSWVPYIATFGFLGMVIAMLGMGIRREVEKNR
jgi:hypothetical protein